MKVLSPKIITLPWKATLAEDFFSEISDYPWAILLHSGYAKHSYSRFDILVSDPIGTLVTYGNITRVSLRETFTSTEEPLTLLNEALNICNFHVESQPDLPFLGGGIGFFGYDLAHRFEKLKRNALKDIHLPDMAIGIYDWALIVDHFKYKVSLLSYSDVNVRLMWLKKQKKMQHRSFQLTTSWCSNIHIDEYKKKFKQIKSYLKNGDCYQVNFAQRFQANYEGDEWQAFTCLNTLNRAPFSAFLRLEEGAILSLSPERFIQLSNGNIQTRPIKGTLTKFTSKQQNSRQIKEQLINSSKDRAENLMIVDLMRNDIGRVAEPGTIRVPELFVIESFSTVYHLVSTITARLSSSLNACDLLRAVFPGGSITGAPKIRAMEIIDELEPHCRNAWCGSIGYLSACGNMDTNIAIRTLIAFNGQLYCSAGGGIVADSHLQTEYQETFDKVGAILKILEN